MTFLEKYLTLINKEISEYNFPRQPENLYEPINYFFQLGGKRIRPVLVLMANHLFSDDFQKAMPGAHLVELFHNFSLVHDDIMDEAPIRRGKPTVHTKWNKNIAILSGDMMLIKAYQQLEKLSPEKTHKVLQIFNNCAIKVCEGQQYDMNFETHERITVDDYINMIYLKTSALLEYALEIGATLGNANEIQIQKIKNFGKNLGIAFQLMDDILDVYGGENFGKQAGGDIISNKKTFLLLTAIEKANPNQKTSIQKLLKQIENPQEKVKMMTIIYDEIGVKTLAENEVKKYSDIAHQSLEELNGVNEKIKQEFFTLKELLMNRTI